jgi:alpha-tubulin suppressor-like RCC1 family protein
VADPIIMKLQAGVVTNVDLLFRRNSTVTVSANFVEGVKSISSQGMANVAVMADGTVKAWGGLLNGPDVIVPQAVASVPQVATACVGIDSYCALKTDGTVWCWGKNAYGQLGNGTTTDSTTPVRVTGLSNMTALACGGFYACAASEMTNNSAYCWGQNMWGQLGNGTTTSSSTPVQVYGGARGGVYKARRIAIGDSSTCYVSNEGRLACWGVNSHGQLGDATTVNSTTPVTGRLNGPIVDVALGDSHACALKADGSVYCWGSNSNGQLGNGDLSVTQSLTPVLVSGITGATKLAAGGATNCVKTQDGRAACWGRNTNGELGNATTIDSAVPVFVSGLTSVSNVAVGGTHTCAMTDNLSVYCWGANSVGELGTGDYNYSSLPKLVQMQ